MAITVNGTSVVSIPIAVLIWLMIYPMMMKVDFASIKDVGRSPKGLFLTWVVNWLIKPFTMFGIAAFFFFVVFDELARKYHGRRTADFDGINRRQRFQRTTRLPQKREK